MWVIDDSQIQMISDAMRAEFEQRAFNYISKKLTELNVFFYEKWLDGLINSQMAKLIKWDIVDENIALEFMWLSVNYDFLLTDDFDKQCSDIIMIQKDDESKIEMIIEYIKTEGYVSKY